MELRGRQVGVYTAVTNEDGKEIEVPFGVTHPAFGVGHLRCMNANKVSHAFDFHGNSQNLSCIIEDYLI